MFYKIIITVFAAALGIGLANTPLKKYQLFNILMDFIGSGGIG